MLKYDEMYTKLPYEFFSKGTQIRDHYKVYDDWLARQPGDMMAKRRAEVDAFLTASRTGDLAGLMAVLDPNVVVRADVFAGGGQARELRGAETVAAFYNGLAQAARTALVDGAIGAVVAPLGKLYLLLDIRIENGKVVEIIAVGDPRRLETAEVAAV